MKRAVTSRQQQADSSGNAACRAARGTAAYPARVPYSVLARLDFGLSSTSRVS